MVGRLKVWSKQWELQYWKFVLFCICWLEVEVDWLFEILMKVVELEKGEFEFGRVRRFFGGVEGVVV